MEGPRWNPDSEVVPFTRPARRLLVAAAREADRLRHDYIGTEHLVLALTRQPEEVALLARLGVDLHRVRRLMEEAVLPGRARVAESAERPYTSRTKRAFSLAAEAARGRGAAGVGVEDILVGLYREGRNIGAEVLQRCGLTMDQLVA